MPFRSAVIDRVHIVRWKQPTAPDIEPVLEEVKTAHAELGAPLFGVAVLPLDLVPPDDEVRAKMALRMDELLGLTECLLFVIEGSGFRQALIRSTLTAILFLSKNRGRVFVHSTIDAALAQVARRLTLPVPQILRSAQALGLLTQPARDNSLRP